MIGQIQMVGRIAGGYGNRLPEAGEGILKLIEVSQDQSAQPETIAVTDEFFRQVEQSLGLRKAAEREKLKGRGDDSWRGDGRKLDLPVHERCSLLHFS